MKCLRVFSKYVLLSNRSTINIPTFGEGMQSFCSASTDNIEYFSKQSIYGHNPEISFLRHGGQRKPFRISIEGNIGAGKSTMINYFSNTPGIESHSEPVDLWRNLRGYNMLDLQYKDPDKWYNVFQMYVQLTRLKIQTAPVKNPTTSVQMFERSLQCNRYCFVEQAVKAGLLCDAEFQIVDQWYDLINTNMDIHLDLIVYLRAAPEIVYGRMVKRGESEEDNVPLEYLQDLHECHENWLISNKSKGIPVLVLDAGRPLEELVTDYEYVKGKIFNKIMGISV